MRNQLWKPDTADNEVIQRIILPIPTGLDQGADEYGAATRLTDPGEAAKTRTVRHDQDLTQLPPTETIYVIGHGNMQTIAGMPPAVFANYLIGQRRLTPGFHGTINLIACLSGVAPLHAQSYAEQFQAAMRQRGCNVKVVAAKGLASVKDKSFAVKPTDFDQSQRLDRLEAHVLKGGTLTNPPDPKLLENANVKDVDSAQLGDFLASVDRTIASSNVATRKVIPKNVLDVLKELAGIESEGRDFGATGFTAEERPADELFQVLEKIPDAQFQALHANLPTTRPLLDLGSSVPLSGAMHPQAAATDADAMAHLSQLLSQVRAMTDTSAQHHAETEPADDEYDATSTHHAQPSTQNTTAVPLLNVGGTVPSPGTPHQPAATADEEAKVAVQALLAALQVGSHSTGHATNTATGTPGTDDNK